jgi:Mg2+ and Co2+ transporter CorA
LIKEYVRPCINVIRHIINDPDLAEDDDGSSGDGGGKSNTNGVGDRLLKKIEIKQYFEDIDDTLNLYTESIEHMAGLCDSYNSEFTGYGDKRMNDILFVLTIVTTLFVPAQFFTGVFGMNFVKKDGSPNMPLLNW